MRVVTSVRLADGCRVHADTRTTAMRFAHGSGYPQDLVRRHTRALEGALGE
jgi:hypothetical protein